MKNQPLSPLNNALLVLLLTFSNITLATVVGVAETEETVLTTETGEQQRKPDEDKVNPLDKVEVNIIKRNNSTIETHSVNGVVYEVKIQPDNAPAYYLYDTDGDGTLETRSEKKFSDITVQQWKIFEW